MTQRVSPSPPSSSPIGYCHYDTSAGDAALERGEGSYVACTACHRSGRAPPMAARCDGHAAIHNRSGFGIEIPWPICDVCGGSLEP